MCTIWLPDPGCDVFSYSMNALQLNLGSQRVWSVLAPLKGITIWCNVYYIATICHSMGHDGAAKLPGFRFPSISCLNRTVKWISHARLTDSGLLKSYKSYKNCDNRFWPCRAMPMSLDKGHLSNRMKLADFREKERSLNTLLNRWRTSPLLNRKRPTRA
jgi:hypothetical protein